MITKKQATKLRKLIRDYVWTASEQECALRAPGQGNINWGAEEIKARRALMAYIKSIEEPAPVKPVSKIEHQHAIEAIKTANREAQLIKINQAISDPNT